jgi:hypothetical protein
MYCVNRRNQREKENSIVILFEDSSCGDS